MLLFDPYVSSFCCVKGRVEHGYYCRPDLVATDCNQKPHEFLGKFFVDSLVHDADALRFLISKVGKDRVVLGSDYPFPLGEVENTGACIEECNFDTQTLEKLMWKVCLLVFSCW